MIPWPPRKENSLIRITTLIENSPGEHLALRNEHGLSFCIEKDGRKVLFDSGQSSNFLHNAEQLRIDLRDLEYVAVSHGHYDHSGGIPALAEIAGAFELVVGAGFFEDKYAEREGGGYEFLGNRFDRRFLQDRGIRFREVSAEKLELIPGVWVLGSFRRFFPDEVINPRFKLLRDGRFVVDPFDDEIMVAVETPKGIVALLGCSHPGMRNMLKAVEDRFDKPIYAVLGGTHLVEASGSSLDAALSRLGGKDISIVGVSHCTGAAAMKRLGDAGIGYFHNRTGSSLVIA